MVAPRYEERGDDPLEHAVGKARSVECAPEQPVLGVDTVVVCDGLVLGKPESPAEAERMLEALAGRTHEVVSGTFRAAHITSGGRLLAGMASAVQIDLLVWCCTITGVPASTVCDRDHRAPLNR